LSVHAWIYGLHDGLVHQLGLNIDSPQALAEQYPVAISALAAQGKES
jgi:carbonic anhydrase